jgi:hypothetical protein
LPLLFMFSLVSDCVAMHGDRCGVTPRVNASSSAIMIRTHKHRPTNKREQLFRSNHSLRAPLIQC